MRITVDQPRPERRRCTCCRSCGSATPGLGPDAPKPALRRTGAGAWSSATHPHLPALRLVCDGAPELLFTDNETNARPPVGQRATRGYFKDGINDSVVDGDATRSTPAQRHQGRGALPLRAARRGAARSACAWPGATRSAGFADFDADRGPAPRRGGRILRARCSPTSPSRGAPGQRQAFAGLIWSQAVLPLRRGRWLRRRSGCSRRRRPRRQRPQPRLAALRTTPTSCRCPTHGSIPGTRPGTSPSTASPWR